MIMVFYILFINIQFIKTISVYFEVFMHQEFSINIRLCLFDKMLYKRPRCSMALLFFYNRASVLHSVGKIGIQMKYV